MNRQRQPWERLDEVAEHRQLCRARIEHLVEVREPLVLISQIQRSCGTLLSQLLDAHPECHAHAQELKIGHPRKGKWPPLDLGRPEEWYRMLYEPRLGKDLVRGYRKSPRPEEADVFPFLFSSRLQKAIFDHCVESNAIERERDVLDCYFTSYFNAWLDNQNLYTRPKKVVTGFAARLGVDLASVGRFFAVYPDGTLFSIVRRPQAWYDSSRKLDSAERHGWHEVDNALAFWRRGTDAVLAAYARYGDRMVVITYDQLVGDTETTMRYLAERIGISMSPILLSPTFNGRPIRANSSERVERHGVLPERAESYRRSLDAETIARIDELAGDLYDRAASIAAPQT